MCFEKLDREVLFSYSYIKYWGIAIQLSANRKKLVERTCFCIEWEWSHYIPWAAILSDLNIRSQMPWQGMTLFNAHAVTTAKSFKNQKFRRTTSPKNSRGAYRFDIFVSSCFFCTWNNPAVSGFLALGPPRDGCDERSTARVCLTWVSA